MAKFRTGIGFDIDEIKNHRTEWIRTKPRIIKKKKETVFIRAVESESLNYYIKIFACGAQCINTFVYLPSFCFQIYSRGFWKMRTQGGLFFSTPWVT